MSDCSPLRLTENEQSSPSQSLGSQSSRVSTANVRRDIVPEPDHHADNELRNHRSSSGAPNSDDAQGLKYGAKNVIDLLVPVSICMLIVVATIKAIDTYHYSSQSFTWYAQMLFTDQTVDTGTRVLQSFANALIMLLCIIVMTTILILLYKFRFYRVIRGWLILGSLSLLFMFSLNYVAEILRAYNIPMDNYSVTIFIWNFGVLGMMVIHWKGPLILQQGYLIVVSALMALILIRSLPDWTIWTVLGIVSVWDLVAVLCPKGPLRILVETAQDRNEPIFPALIYSSTMMWEFTSLMADQRRPKARSNKRDSKSAPGQPESSPSTSLRRQSNRPLMRDQHPVEIQYEDGAEPPEVAFVQPAVTDREVADRDWPRPNVRAVSSVNNCRNNRARRHETSSGDIATSTELTINFNPQNLDRGQTCQIVEEEECGVKLGLGDFIFFSVLVGKASSYGDWTVTISCYVAILVGLCLTLSLLALFRKALPALPISIVFGMSSFFLTNGFVIRFCDSLAMNQLFI